MTSRERAYRGSWSHREENLKRSKRLTLVRGSKLLMKQREIRLFSYVAVAGSLSSM